MSATDFENWQDREVIGSDGDSIGKVKDIYEDEHTGKPEWALVSGGLFGMRSHFVPLAGSSTEGEGLRVQATKDQVKNAPSVEGDGQLSQDEERMLFEHYGVPYTDEGSVTAQEGAGVGGGTAMATETAERDHVEAGTVGHDTSGPETDQAITRSEEELTVGKTQRESGRVRLRKYVVTDMVTKTVPVEREEVRIEREPITDENRGAAHDGPAISEEEHEVVLHEEVPVVEKETVAKERVRLGTETVTEEREVSEEVRKERIETEGDALSGERTAGERL